jgi:hypothetical protein
MPAFETSENLADGTIAADLLARKTEMGGWGQCWLSYGCSPAPACFFMTEIHGTLSDRI